MLWNMIKELPKVFVVIVKFGVGRTTVKDLGEMSITAQVALQVANSCSPLKKKKVGSHREHVVADAENNK